MRVHFREQYGTKGNEILYVTPDDQNNIVRVPLKSDKIIIKEQNTFSRIFQEIFLPHGFPDSVSEDYVTYQIWDTIQAFCSTISGGFSRLFALSSSHHSFLTSSFTHTLY